MNKSKLIMNKIISYRRVDLCKLSGKVHPFIIGCTLPEGYMHLQLCYAHVTTGVSSKHSVPRDFY